MVLAVPILRAHIRRSINTVFQVNFITMYGNFHSLKVPESWQYSIPSTYQDFRKTDVKLYTAGITYVAVNLNCQPHLRFMLCACCPITHLMLGIRIIELFLKTNLQTSFTILFLLLHIRKLQCPYPPASSLWILTKRDSRRGGPL